MEPFLYSMFANTALFFVAIPIILYIIFKRNNHDSSRSNLPRGNLGLPFIGETFKFFSSSRTGMPENFIFERMIRYSPKVFKTSLLGETTMVFCGHQGNKFLFSNENKLVTGWWPKSLSKIFPLDDNETVEEHTTRSRKFFLDVIRPDSFNKCINLMDKNAQRHFATSWEGQEQVHVYSLAKRYTFGIACLLLLSIDDPKEVEQLAEEFEALASGMFSLPINLPGTSFNRGVRASTILQKKLMEIIKQRKREMTAEDKPSPKQDILSHMLLHANENGQHISEKSIATKILGFIFAGHDTTTGAISAVAKYLAELPHVYAQVFKEQMEILKSKEEEELLNWGDIQKMQYSWNVACEAMRLASPGQGSFRVAITDFNFAGFLIPKGSKIYWTSNSTHKNPEYFPDPEKFDPSRFEGNGPAPYTFMPFGGGPKKCPGKDFARLEILVFMHNIVRRFKWEKLVPDEKIIIDPFPRPTHGLPVKLHPHKI